MAKQSINIGTSANDGSGTSLRDGGDLINDNFNEIYTAIGDGTTITTGTFVTDSNTVTLTNKTLTSPVINSATLTSPVINSPTGDFIKIEGTDFTNSILIGHSTTGTLSSAQKNTGVGIEALDALTSGDQNNALGYKALTSVNSGGRNTGIGHRAGENLTTGSFNTYVGDDTSRKNVIGSNNSSYGANALEGATNSSHSYNSAFGSESLKCVTTGGRNIGIGYQAGDNITTGSGSVIIGSVDADSATGDRQLKIAGYDGSTTTTWIKGDNTGQLTISGAYTLPASDGSANQVLQTDGSGTLSFADMTSGASSIDELSDGVVANTCSIGLGSNALLNVSTGVNNTALGYNSACSITSTSCNTAIGTNALRLNTSCNNTAIGNDAMCKATGGQQNVVIGNQTYHCALAGGVSNVIIGERAACMTTGSGGFNSNVMVGALAGYETCYGCFNVFIGRGAGGSFPTPHCGSNNIIIGYATEMPSATASNSIVLGNSNISTFSIPGIQSGASSGDVLTYDGTSLALSAPAAGGTSWQAVKTSSFTAVAGEGYFIDTTSAAITMTLPASPSQGDEVAFIDYAGTADSNNITIARNGSNIAGAASDLTVSVERAANSLVYVDATQGWLLTSK